MQELFVEKLNCPIDFASLSLSIFEQDPDSHIMTGQLQCTSCQRTYPIKKGVPHLLSEESIEVNGRSLEQLQNNTIERFGFEWRYYQNWGWLTEYPDVPNAKEKFSSALMEHTRQHFWGKSLFEVDDLKPGQLVLDAGCGNGRFTYQAAQMDVDVIGIDLGWGVYSAFENTRHLPNVHIVRGDLFRLPFSETMFDRIFSIGVLQHTGNAQAAFDSLIRCLRPDGLIAVRVYGQGKRSYEILDAAIRSVTTRIPISFQISFAKFTAGFTRWLRSNVYRRRIYRNLFPHINLLPTEHEMFDWWSAPIATHHTLEEVQSWFHNNQLKILRTKPLFNNIEAERTRYRNHGPISVLGQLLWSVKKNEDNR